MKIALACIALTSLASLPADAGAPKIAWPLEAWTVGGRDYTGPSENERYYWTYYRRHGTEMSTITVERDPQGHTLTTRTILKDGMRYAASQRDGGTWTVDPPAPDKGDDPKVVAAVQGKTGRDWVDAYEAATQGYTPDRESDCGIEPCRAYGEYAQDYVTEDGIMLRSEGSDQDNNVFDLFAVTAVRRGDPGPDSAWDVPVPSAANRTP